VKRAQDWRWGSLWARQFGTSEQKAVLTDWPIKLPIEWVKRVNEPLTDRDTQRVRLSILRDRPFGGDSCTRQIVTRLKLGRTIRDEGRPRVKPETEAKGE